MTVAGLISLLLAIAKAVPAAAGLCQKVIEFCERFDKAKNEKDALERLQQKDRAVDDFYDGEWMRSHPPEQQRGTDEARSESGLREVQAMEEGSAQDSQQTRTRN